MPLPNPCEAAERGDVTECARCGLTWDTNDPDPPTCGYASPAARHVHAKADVDRVAADWKRQLDAAFQAGREFERTLQELKK